MAHGVVVGLTAWNYPAALMCRKMGPALVAGNTIVIKSHEGTPISALEIAQLSSQIDFPPGVINVVSGTGEGIGAALVRHPIARLITLTGSVRAGKEIFRSAADDLKLIKGVGPQNEKRLHALGIWHFSQIAAWTPENVEWVGGYLAFPGRIGWCE